MAALNPTVDINTSPLAAAQVATTFGPQTQRALRQSQYLADALRQLQTSGQDIKGGWGELGSKLLAQAILQRSNNKGQDALIQAMTADRNDESSRLLSGLNPPSAAPAAPSGAIDLPPTPAPQPAIQAAAPEPTQAAPPAAPTPVSASPLPAAYGTQDRDALTHMLATEAVGEGPQGMAAAGHVALNRLKAGYGGAKTLADVVYQPHQFEGITRGHTPSQADLAAAGTVADQLLAGQVPDPTNGAMAFLNPELQTKLGRKIPAWAQGGDGQRIGNHVFFGGQGPAVGAQPPPPPAPPAPGDIVPPDAATASAGADPFPPSAPATSGPPAVGTAPAGSPPQAPPAGATGAWPTWKPSTAELDYVKSLLNSPRDHAAGVALAQHYRQKMTEPEEAQITLINGVPFYIPKDPTSAAHTQPIPVPNAAMTQVKTAEQLGVAAPHGTTFSADPLGNVKPLAAPPNGQEVVAGPGGRYAEHYVPGGVNDPTRQQTPPPGFRLSAGGQLEAIPGGPSDLNRPQQAPQGYAFAGGPGGSPGSQAPIVGGPADPRAPMNLAAGTQKIQENLRPTIDLAVVAKQAVGAVQQGFKQQNGTGDIAMVNGLQHLIDKGVVRGEDVNMQMKSNGIAGGLGQLTQYINSNGLLTPDVRQKVLKAAGDLYANIDQQYRSQIMSHRATVDAVYGDGSFDKFVLPLEQQQALGWAAQGQGAQTPPQPATANAPELKPGTREAAIAEAKRRGLIH